MAKGRILSKAISYDKEVAGMTGNAIILYTWCIAHLDVKGRMYGDKAILKGTVVPYIESIGIDDVPELLGEMKLRGLVEIYGDDNEYIYFPGFNKNQKLNEDREAKSIIPNQPGYEEKIKETKEVSEDIKRIIDVLNQCTDKSYSYTGNNIDRYLKPRLSNGATVEDCIAVIKFKWEQWGTDKKMKQYVRINTLFRPSNFEEYIQESKQNKKKDGEDNLNDAEEAFKK